MTEMEKVIKGLEQFKADLKPFCGNRADWERFDAGLALLKEQEEQIKNRDESLKKAREEIKWLRGMMKEQEAIVRCKDCNHHYYENDDIPYCDRIVYGYGWRDDDYCSRAKRKDRR